MVSLLERKRAYFIFTRTYWLSWWLLELNVLIKWQTVQYQESAYLCYLQPWCSLKNKSDWRLCLPDLPQQKQSFREPLSWRFPDPPAEEEPRFPPDFELKAPPAADSISAVCGENYVQVEAKKDLLGIGTPIQAADISLGGCPPTGEDAEAQVLVFESELHGCGSQLLVRASSHTQLHKGSIFVFVVVFNTKCDCSWPLK